MFRQYCVWTVLGWWQPPPQPRQLVLPPQCPRNNASSAVSLEYCAALPCASWCKHSVSILHCRFSLSVMALCFWVHRFCFVPTTIHDINLVLNTSTCLFCEMTDPCNVWVFKVKHFRVIPPRTWFSSTCPCRPFTFLSADDWGVADGAGIGATSHMEEVTLTGIQPGDPGGVGICHCLAMSSLEEHFQVRLLVFQVIHCVWFLQW